MESFPRSEIRRVAAKGSYQFFRPDRSGDFSKEFRFVRITVNARGVGQEMLQGDAAATRKTRKKFIQRISEGQLSLLHEAQDGGGGELFSHGANAKLGFYRHRYLFIRICPAKATLINDFPIAGQKDGYARLVGFGQFSQPRLNAFLQRHLRAP